MNRRAFMQSAAAFSVLPLVATHKQKQVRGENDPPFVTAFRWFPTAHAFDIAHAAGELTVGPDGLVIYVYDPSGGLGNGYFCPGGTHPLYLFAARRRCLYDDAGSPVLQHLIVVAIPPTWPVPSWVKAEGVAE